MTHMIILAEMGFRETICNPDNHQHTQAELFNCVAAVLVIMVSAIH